MSSTGRRKDSIWTYFIEIPKHNKTPRAKCRKCKAEMAALVARMKTHFQKCSLATLTDKTHIESDTDDDTFSVSSDNTLKRNLGYMAKHARKDLGEGSEGYRSVDTSSAGAASEGVLASSCGSLEIQSSDLNMEVYQPPSVVSGAALTRSRLDRFVIRTSSAEKKLIDLQIARFIFGTNSAFQHVEHPEFIKMIEMLHPGYKPPNRKQIANELLNDVYYSVNSAMKINLNGKVVCMALDGWSNIHNEAIVCVSLTDVLEESVYLVDSIDTADNSHDADYLLHLAVNAIKQCQRFQCTVRSFVTDNAANMVKMREELAKSEEPGSGTGLSDIITYGCSAHILNLLAHDLEITGVKDHVKQVIKYFKNHHFPAAKYKQAGGKALMLPQDVRWNTLADGLESYIQNWHILSKVCTENRAAIDTTISSKVFNINLKVNAEDYLRKLKKIAVALDKVQKDTCTIGEAAEIWLHLAREFKNDPDSNPEDLEHCERRFEMAITAPHFLANLLDSRFRGSQLSQEQLDRAMEYVASFHPTAMPEVICYQAKSAPFREYLFSDLAVQSVKPITWWMALKNTLSAEMLDLVFQLHSAVASSAGIERLFSSFGFVHSKIRNRLGSEKASKLVSIFKELNRKNIPKE